MCLLCLLNQAEIKIQAVTYVTHTFNSREKSVEIYCDTYIISWFLFIHKTTWSKTSLKVHIWLCGHSKCNPPVALPCSFYFCWLSWVLSYCFCQREDKGRSSRLPWPPLLTLFLHFPLLFIVGFHSFWLWRSHRQRWISQNSGNIKAMGKKRRG